MNVTLKLTITWLLLVAATLLSFFAFELPGNGNFVTILAYKKFLLIGFVYLEVFFAHWFYRILIILLGGGLLIGDLIWEIPKVCP